MEAILPGRCLAGQGAGKHAMRIVLKARGGEQGGCVLPSRVMMRWTLPVLAAGCFLQVAAQSSVAKLGGSSDAAQRLFDGGLQSAPDTVYDLASVEEQPEFPGGQDAMYAYLAAQTKYPDEAVEGKVYVEFVVRKDGLVDLVVVRRGVSRLLDAEAVRVVRSMPRWEPGRMKGQPVAVRFTLPIVFVLGRDTNGASPGDTR